MTRRLPLALALWTMVAGLITYLWTIATSKPADATYLADLEIYRGAVRAAAAGGSLYDYVFHHPAIRPEGLGFTYPPFAGLVLWPLAWLPAPVTDGLWSAATLMTVVIVAFVSASRLPVQFVGKTATRVTAGMIALLLLVSYPVISDLFLGQVSLFVMALTLVDALCVPRRYRGVLTGLAAAIKLTPLAFAVYFLATKQWRTVFLTAVTFLFSTALAIMVLPRDSLSYWTLRLWQTENVGEPTAVRNKSVYGMLVRWLDVPWLGLLWAVAVLILTVAAARATWRHGQEGDALAGAITAGCLSIAVFPISWPHYLTWSLLAGARLLFTPGWGWRLLGIGAVVTHSIASPWIDGPSGPGPLSAIAQEIPVLFAVLVAALGLPRPTTSQSTLREDGSRALAVASRYLSARARGRRETRTSAARSVPE